MQALLWFIGVTLIGAIGGAVFYEKKRDDWAAPDLKVMRAYRVSHMTDEQIRELNIDAVAEASRFKKMDQETREKAFKEAPASAQRCSDVVYRERNSAECNRGTPLGLLYEDTHLTPTAEKIFEENLLGICRFVHTKQEARLNKCLPTGEAVGAGQKQ